MKKRIIIVGSGFAGYTTAVQLAKATKSRYDISVIDKKPEFVFTPSLVWFPFGKKKIENSSFDTRPIYEKLGVTFIESIVYGFDLEDQLIYTPDRDIEYDYLVIATGSTPKFASIKGLYPNIHTWSVFSGFEHAQITKKAWKEYLKKPGPLVVGTSQWGGYSYVAYEFLFNALYQLHKADLLDNVPIHFITSEPFLGHFGIGGLGEDSDKAMELFKSFNIKVHLNAEIHEVKSNEVILEGGTVLPSSFTMIIPPFNGIDAVKTTRKFGNENGLIRVTDQFYHPNHPNVFVAGGAISVVQKADSKVGIAMPCTHSFSEMTAKAIAQNITAEIEGGIHAASTTEELYSFIRKDLQYLGNIMFREYSNVTEALNFIAKGSQDKWANHSLKDYIESAYSENFMNIKY